jgi:Raf kinase inhibitor-like YbhB/YbcL family protein
VGHAASAAAASLIAAGLLAGSCGGGGGSGDPLPDAPAKMSISSPAFADNGTIPTRYTCSGAGAAPPLRFSGAPAGTRELALLVEDADADWFVHWTVLGIPSDTRSIHGKAPAGAVETENDFGDQGWGAPCPPEGDKPHRYYFAIYALKARVDSRDDIGEHALASGALVGRFGR